MHVAYRDFPIEEKAAFREICKKLGLVQTDFELEADVETLELAGWRTLPHLVKVTHTPTARSRLCSGWPKKSWIETFAEQVRKYQFLSAR